MASASVASFSGVDVPCAFMCPMRGGVEAGVVERELHARGRACAAGRRRGDVVGVGVAAVAEHLAVDGRTPRQRALEGLEDANAAPSAMTKPSRAASNGRDARCGIVVAGAHRAHAGERRDRERRDAGLGAAGDHDLGAAVAHHADAFADRVGARRARGGDAEVGPVKPKLIEIIPAVAFGIIIGTKNGLTRLAPRARNVASFSSIVSSPPTPVAAITANRLGSAPSSPASASASAAAPKPSCVKRSSRRTSFGPK